MIIVNNSPVVPKGMCGVYLLEITDLKKAKYPKDGKDGFAFTFTVNDPDYTECKDVLSDTFYLGPEAWRLNSVLKAIGLNRKNRLGFDQIIGKKLWAAVRNNDVISPDGEVIETYSSIFEYHIVGPGAHRPLYLGDPKLNNGVPTRRFNNVIEQKGVIPIVENIDEDEGF